MRILLADDHPVFLSGVRRVLELDGGFEVVAEVRHGREVLPTVGRTHPEVVLLDVRMPELDGLTCLDRLRASYPHVFVVMCSMSAAAEQIQSAYDRGASGYIIKNIDPSGLGPAIRRSVAGTASRDHLLATDPGDSVRLAAGLTPRETDVMKAVSRGLSNRTIAKELWVTEQTVKFHLSNLYRKLELSNRTELARWAYGNGYQEEGYEESQSSSTSSRG